MRMSTKLLLAVAATGVGLLSAAPASAASFFCQTQVSQGGPVQLQQTMSAVGCLRQDQMAGANPAESGAQADPGRLRAQAMASSQGNMASASSVVEARDRFTVNGLGANGAVLNFRIGVHGSLFGNASAPEGQFGANTGVSEFDFRASLFTTNAFDAVRYNGCVKNVDPGVSACNGAFDIAAQLTAIANADLPISIQVFNGDVVNLIMALNASAFALSPGPHSSATAQSLFFNTVDWLGLIPNADTANLILTSESGFDYRFSALPPPSGAPEPASWALMILGFGATGVALRRRRLAPA